MPYLKDVAENEFPIIVDNGLADYFLIVSDYTRWAKEHGVEVGPGRGSCAASILCWATGITEVDPMGRGLIFSRFLNEGRLKEYEIDFDDGETVVVFPTTRFILADGTEKRIDEIVCGDDVISII